MLVPSASASIAGSNIFSNVSSMSCLRRSASSNWDGGLSGGDGSGRGSGVSACNHWGVEVAVCWVIPRYYTGLGVLCEQGGGVVSCYGVSGILKNEKIVSGSFQPQQRRAKALPTPAPLPISEIQGNPGRGESRGRGAPSCGESRHRDTLTHIVNVTFLVPITMTFIVTLSQNV